MVDDISAAAVGLERSGMFTIAATLDESKLDRFWPALVAELKGLSAASFTDEELARAKLNLEDSLFQTKETLAGLASKLGHFQFFEGSYREEDNYVYSLAHVDKPAMQGLIDRFLGPDRLHAVLLVPGKPGATGAAGSAGSEGQAAKAILVSAVDKDRLAEQVRTGWPRAERTLTEAESLEARGGMERIPLGQGKELVLIPDTTLPYTSVSLLLNGGDALLAPDEQGLAELAARSLALGTRDMKATRYQDFLSDRA
jgi:zinc protease